MTGSGPALPDADDARDASTTNERAAHIKLAYLAAELERAAHAHRFAAADLDAVRLALVGGLIGPEQALAHVEPTDHFRFFGPLPEDPFCGPQWAESARQYHQDRKSRGKAAAPSKV